MTTTTTDDVRSEAPQNDKDDAAYNYALQSVYYRSLGSELESRGAPVMVVPPQVRPMPLDQALDALKDNQGLLWSAYWRIVRSVPVEGWERPLVRRYPQALVDALGAESVDRLDTIRRHARAKAHFFTAALLAAVEQPPDQVKPLRDLLENDRRLSKADRDIVVKLVEGMGNALGKPVGEFVADLGTRRRQKRAREELTLLQSEVGLNLSDFAEDFLDTVAFQCFKEECALPPKVLNAVLTSSCIVRQDTNTMTTTATVTTLAPGADWEQLRDLIDPMHWSDNSRVIRETQYVKGAFDLSDPAYGTADPTFKVPRLLYEDVHVGWGSDNVQTGGFRNVLTLAYFKADKKKGVSLPFRLCRSIDSRLMWDSRPGGILIDGGYLVARPVGEGSWRVTTRKVLQFSDRAPNSTPAGGMDYGQMINYLAPASVTLWLETDFYESMGRSNGTRAKTESKEQGGA